MEDVSVGESAGSGTPYHPLVYGTIGSVHLTSRPFRLSCAMEICSDVSQCWERASWRSDSVYGKERTRRDKVRND
ncbi:hypothetical protein Pmani_010885 [Petrolisthes manimaculis]|uniref:Uncharacterized protein n=1 Tax=Petrolisthes manimaculis TaxID=1843537 RepID=A0AAE1Q176_9EUCA|nr:hypothetical protein Pmani_010885 [Petrolisthes manimaculis]